MLPRTVKNNRRKSSKKTIKVLKYKKKKSKILANFEIRTRAVFNEHKNFFCLRFVRIGKPWMLTEREGRRGSEF